MSHKKSKKVTKSEPVDKSAVVYQRDKIQTELAIREINWTPKQQELIDLILNKNNKIILIKGPAGSSKTYSAMYCALRLLKNKSHSDITLIRAAVESSDSGLGFLPGEATDKLAPYLVPYMDKLEELLPVPQIKALKADNRFQGVAISFMRGLSWNAKVILLDEAQNLVRKELVTIMTRLGQFSKLIIMGDTTQSDLPASKQGAFDDICKTLSDDESRQHGIVSFEFTEDDIVRSEICSYLVKKLKCNVS